MDQIASLQSDMNPAHHKPLPPVPTMHPEEVPERRQEYSRESLLRFKEEKAAREEAERQAAAGLGEGGFFGGFGGGGGGGGEGGGEGGEDGGESGAGEEGEGQGHEDATTEASTKTKRIVEVSLIHAKFFHPFVRCIKLASNMFFSHSTHLSTCMFHVCFSCI